MPHSQTRAGIKAWAKNELARLASGGGATKIGRFSSHIVWSYLLGWLTLSSSELKTSDSGRTIYVAQSARDSRKMLGVQSNRFYWLWDPEVV